MGVVLGIIGIVLANKDMALYRNNPGVYSEGSYNNTKTGRVCSIIGIVLSLLVIIFYIVWIVFFLSIAASAGSSKWN